MTHCGRTELIAHLSVSTVVPDSSFPTQKSEKDFHWVEEWARLHVARVRDVELLTGLSFYHDQLEIDKTLQLKTSLKSF